MFICVTANQCQEYLANCCWSIIINTYYEFHWSSKTSYHNYNHLFNLVKIFMPCGWYFIKYILVFSLRYFKFFSVFNSIISILWMKLYYEMETTSITFFLFNLFYTLWLVIELYFAVKLSCNFSKVFKYIGILIWLQ